MFNLHSGLLPKKLLAAIRDDRPHTPISQTLVEAATMEIPSVLARFSTSPEGLTSDEARARRAQYGPNVLARTSGRASASCSGTRCSIRW